MTVDSAAVKAVFVFDKRPASSFRLLTAQSCTAS